MPGAAPTVLVADDEPALLDLMGKTLERGGFPVARATDGRAALEALRASRSIEVAILDLTLPPAGGLELMRQLVEVRALGVVLTSGSPANAEARALLAEIGGRFLLKPFPPRALIEAVEALRGGRRP